MSHWDWRRQFNTRTLGLSDMALGLFELVLSWRCSSLLSILAESRPAVSMNPRPPGWLGKPHAVLLEMGYVLKMAKFRVLVASKKI